MIYETIHDVFIAFVLIMFVGILCEIVSGFFKEKERENHDNSDDS